ncbi:hypothetical protein KJ742_06435 [Patescibacteria group bacterium]|nr:hypothetical protein [Patescibacteria group bacterium]MBU1683549.1 hypothetical protein [Patescibacteria group bacterium]
MQRYNFNDIFRENADGTLTPKRTIQLGAATLGSSVTFGQGVSFGGVNIFQFKGADIAGEEDSGVLVIKGFYQ